jgi:hypothetical protein
MLLIKMLKFTESYLKTREGLIGILTAFLGAYVLFPIYFEINIFPLQFSEHLWTSIDSSWIVALNYFKQNNAVWGNDVAFTYGPLAQLYTRLGWGESRYIFLIFDFFIFLNFFLFFYFTYKMSNHKIITLFLISVIVITFPLYHSLIYTLVLFGFLVFWVRLSIDKFNFYYYAFQIVIIVLLFFSKFNTGFVTFPIFLIGLFYNIYNKKVKIYTSVIITFMPIFFIILFSNLLNVNIKNYAKSGFEMVKGYNDVMYLENQIPLSQFIAISSFILLCIVIFWNQISQLRKEFVKIIVTSFVFGLSMFIIYKQAFVRADVGHINDFFYCLPIFVLSSFDLYIKFFKPIVKYVFIIAVMLPIIFINIASGNTINFNQKLSKINYIKGFVNFSETSSLHIFEGNNPLPQIITQKIGKSTVDIYPWNIQLLLENGLNYKQRPVFQSFTSYTQWLQDLNLNFYNSDSSPEFIIYDYAAIDGRYPLFDETKVNLQIIKNYTVSETFDYNNRHILLLHKNKQKKVINFKKINEYAMFIDSPIIPKKNIYYEIYIYHNFYGSLYSTLQHAPEVKLKIQTEDGNIKEFVTSKTLLEIGLFSDQFIENTNDFKNLSQNHDSILKIKKYNLKFNNASLFKKKMRIVEYQIE